jgi:hypothetical protein
MWAAQGVSVSCSCFCYLSGVGWRVLTVNCFGVNVGDSFWFLLVGCRLSCVGCWLSALVVSHFFCCRCRALMIMSYENCVRFLLKLQIFPLHYPHFTFSISKVGSAVSELSHTQKPNWKKSSCIYIYIYIYISYVYEYTSVKQRWCLVYFWCTSMSHCSGKALLLRGKCWNMGWRGWCLEPVLYSFIRYAY